MRLVPPEIGIRLTSVNELFVGVRPSIDPELLQGRWYKMSLYSIESDKYEITLGYDEGGDGYFWLIIHWSYENESNRFDEDGEDKYIFHNIDNWPGIRMQINDIRKVLATFDETLPVSLLPILYEEVLAKGFFAALDPKDFQPASTRELEAKHF